MQERLKWLNKEIAAIDKRLVKIDQELAQSDIRLQELNRLEDRIKSGKIDPNNEADRKLMEKYGIDQAAIDNGTWILLIQQQKDAERNKQGDLNKEKDGLQKKRETLADERDDLNEKIRNNPELEKEILLVASNEALAEERRIDKSGTSRPDDAMSENAVAEALEAQFDNGDKVDGRVFAVEETRLAEADSILSSGFFAAKLDGEGTYTNGVGEEGLSAKKDFNIASSNNTYSAPPSLEKPDVGLEQTVAVLPASPSLT